MCLICVDLIKQKITSEEAKKNLNEMVIGNEVTDELQKHVEEVLNLIDHIKNLEMSGL
jgi:hypothetical protein